MVLDQLRFLRYQISIDFLESKYQIQFWSSILWHLSNDERLDHLLRMIQARLAKDIISFQYSIIVHHPSSHLHDSYLTFTYRNLWIPWNAYLTEASPELIPVRPGESGFSVIIFARELAIATDCVRSHSMQRIWTHSHLFRTQGPSAATCEVQRWHWALHSSATAPVSRLRRTHTILCRRHHDNHDHRHDDDSDSNILYST